MLFLSFMPLYRRHSGGGLLHPSVNHLNQSENFMDDIFHRFPAPFNEGYYLGTTSPFLQTVP